MVKMKGDVQVPEPGRSGKSPSRPARFHMILDEILFNLFGSHLYVRHNKCVCGVKHGCRIRPSQFYQWSRSPKKQLSTSATRQRQMKSKVSAVASLVEQGYGILLLFSSSPVLSSPPKMMKGNAQLSRKGKSSNPMPIACLTGVRIGRPGRPAGPISRGRGWHEGLP